MTPPVPITPLLARGEPWCSGTIYKFNTHLKIMIKINREAESTGKSQMELERNLHRQRGKMKVVFPNTWNSRCPCAFCRASMLPCKASSALLAHLNRSSKYSSLVLLLTVICSSWDCSNLWSFQFCKDYLQYVLLPILSCNLPLLLNIWDYE